MLFSEAEQAALAVLEKRLEKMVEQIILSRECCSTINIYIAKPPTIAIKMVAVQGLHLNRHPPSP
jgi:hypothetical protein